MIVLLSLTIQQALVVAPMMSVSPKSDPASQKSYFEIMVILEVVLLVTLSLLVLIVSVIDVFFIGYLPIETYLMIIFSLTTFLAQDFTRKIFILDSKIKHSFFLDFVSYGSQIALIITFILFQKISVLTALFAINFTSLAATIFFSSFYISKKKKKFAEIKIIFIRNWCFSKWMLPSTFFNWMSGNIFIFFSANLLGVQSVGAIAAARNLLGPTIVFFSACENYFLKEGSIVYRKRRLKGLIEYMRKFTIVGGFFTILICSSIAFFSENLLKLCYGPEFVQYNFLVYWFSATHILMFFVRPYMFIFSSIEKTKVLAKASFLSLCFSTLCSAPFIMILKLHGAMFVMFGTQIIIILHYIMALRKEKNTPVN